MALGFLGALYGIKIREVWIQAFFPTYWDHSHGIPFCNNLRMWDGKQSDTRRGLDTFIKKNYLKKKKKRSKIFAVSSLDNYSRENLITEKKRSFSL